MLMSSQGKPKMTRASVSLCFLLFISSLLFASHLSGCEAQAKPPVVDGLSWTFYDSSCSKLESIVRNHLEKVFKNDIGQAAALLRIFFHDCFVQGCDGSVLLDATPPNNTSEKDTIPNSTLRPEAFKTIDDLRALAQNQCGTIVSCADITVLAARDAVFLSGGPDFDVPLGRRDSLTFNVNETSNLPSPFTKTTVILNAFTSQNFDVTEVVALSGAHTIGRAHCGAFAGRLFPDQDTTMDKTFANNLKITCPSNTTDNTSVLDIRTPNKFDNKYYVDLMNRQGLFTSDQDLYTDSRTKGIVTGFASNQSLFFEKFANAIIKMSQLSVLTGSQGEIRSNCSATNKNVKSLLTSVVEEVVEVTQF